MRSLFIGYDENKERLFLTPEHLETLVGSRTRAAVLAGLAQIALNPHRPLWVAGVEWLHAPESGRECSLEIQGAFRR